MTFGHNLRFVFTGSDSASDREEAHVDADVHGHVRAAGAYGQRQVDSELARALEAGGSSRPSFLSPFTATGQLDAGGHS